MGALLLVTIFWLSFLGASAVGLAITYYLARAGWRLLKGQSLRQAFGDIPMIGSNWKPRTRIRDILATPTHNTPEADDDAQPEPAEGAVLPPATPPWWTDPATDPAGRGLVDLILRDGPALDRRILESGHDPRFIQTLTQKWAYERPYRTSALRTSALRPWIKHYNHERPHRELGKKPPFARLREARQQRA